MGVVVEAPDQAGVEREGDAEGAQAALHPVEVGPGAGVEHLGHAAPLEGGLGGGMLGVEDPQRVGLDLLAVLGGEVGGPVAQPRGERRGVGRPVGGVPIVLTPGTSGQAQRLQVGVAEGDDLDVHVGVGGADDLDVQLVVLAEAAGLGPLVAEGRGDAPPSRA